MPRNPDRRLVDLGLAIDIPDNLGGAIAALKDRVITEHAVLDENEPGPLAPIGERIAHVLGVARAHADSDILEVLIGVRRGLQEEAAKED